MFNFKSVVVVCMILVLSFSFVGCKTQEELGTFGEGEGVLKLHAGYARAAGAPAVTVLVKERHCGKATVKAAFSQTDLATVGLHGVTGMGAAALNGMTFGMFRRPDKYNSHTSVSGGNSGASSSSNQRQGQRQHQRQHQRNVQRNMTTQNNGGMPMMPMGGRD
jgi:hypothetical protein